MFGKSAQRVNRLQDLPLAQHAAEAFQNDNFLMTFFLILNT
jgi:hypothetical protein